MPVEDTTRFHPQSCTIRSDDTFKFQSHSIFKFYRTALWLQHVFWPSTSHLCSTWRYTWHYRISSPGNSKTRLVTIISIPFDFLNCFLTIYNTFISRRCQTWHHSISIPWNCKSRSVDTGKFQSHSIFKFYRRATCFLINHITFIARRCSTWHYSISIPWNRKSRSVDTCKFQSHSIFKIYCTSTMNPHVFW